MAARGADGYVGGRAGGRQPLKALAAGRHVRPLRWSRRTVSGFFSTARDFQRTPSAGLCDIAQNTGYLFNGYADILGVRDGSLLAVGGGGTSLTSRLRFVDLSGLAEPRIAGLWQRNDMAGLRNYIFDEVKPTFIKIFSGWAERDQLDLIGDPRLEQDYVMLLSGHLAAAGGCVVIRCATPWRWMRRGGGGRMCGTRSSCPQRNRAGGVVVRRRSAARSTSRGLTRRVPLTQQP